MFFEIGHQTIEILIIWEKIIESGFRNVEMRVDIHEEKLAQVGDSQKFWLILLYIKAFLTQNLEKKL